MAVMSEGMDIISTYEITIPVSTLQHPGGADCFSYLRMLHRNGEPL